MSKQKTKKVTLQDSPAIEILKLSKKKQKKRKQPKTDIVAQIVEQQAEEAQELLDVMRKKQSKTKSKSKSSKKQIRAAFASFSSLIPPVKEMAIMSPELPAENVLSTHARRISIEAPPKPDIIADIEEEEDDEKTEAETETEVTVDKSSEKLGQLQRAVLTKRKFDRDFKSAAATHEYLKAHSPQTLVTMMEGVAESFTACSPFLESTLLIAWLFDAEKCEDIVLRCCKKVLRAPIKAQEYDWFKNYVFPSHIWMQKSTTSAQDDDPDGTFMYERLMEIGHQMSSNINMSRDSIFLHLQSHQHWPKVTAIENQSLIARQDDASVGLLKEDGFTNIFEMKTDEGMKHLIDSNMAINKLTSTASIIDDDFQRHIDLVMSAHGTFQRGPMKKVERSLSKVENDYKTDAFPRAAKLLDLVRCSVTFNTIEQLIAGYNAFLRHIQMNPTIIELARVKNGFINTDGAYSGYRDIKLNVVYKSQSPEHDNVRMICEVQFLLINYLEEKKKIHKLYSILREETFFKITCDLFGFFDADDQDGAEDEDGELDGDIKPVEELKFTEILAASIGAGPTGTADVTLNYSHEQLFKCTLDSELGLLAMECTQLVGVVDVKSKREIWKLPRQTVSYHTHKWLTLGSHKYFSVQTERNCIKMFKVEREPSGVGKWKFTEDVNRGLVYSSNKGDDAVINHCDFDEDGKHIYLVVDNRELQKRPVDDMSTVLCRIALDEAVSGSLCRNFRTSADGLYCVLSGGEDKNYLYVVDIENKSQFKLTSGVLCGALAPCFINGANDLVAVCDQEGRIEIWDLGKKTSVKTFQIETKSAIKAATSAHNMLAVGSDDQMMRLYDVANWKCFHTSNLGCTGRSVHLTEDLKYAAFAGMSSQKGRCVVLEIE